MDENCCIRTCWIMGLLLVSCLVIAGSVPTGAPHANTSTQHRLNYTGHQVIRVQPSSEDQLEHLMDLVGEEQYQVDFWGEPDHNSGPNHTTSVDLHVPPQVFAAFSTHLDEAALGWHVVIPDIQFLIDQENEAQPDNRGGRHKRSFNNSNSRTENDVTSLFYDFSVVGRYARQHEINNWMDTAVNSHPDIVSIINIGQSYEGRPLKVIRIGWPANRASYYRKPGIWLDAGIHAREWVAPATATFIINKLLSQYGRCRCVAHLIKRLDWYILPVANPDGYEYSHDVDRLWRKTRRPSGDCMGVDANRNFDYHWARFSRCLNIFPGEFPFSEPETRAISNFLLEKQDIIKAYISLHSYSQMWLHTWGYSSDPPPNYDDIIRVANRSVRALQAKHGMTYVVGSPADILYPAHGTSMDWAAGVAGIKYSVSVELRDRGTYGFLLPSTQIVPTAQEAWAGISAMAKEILKEIRV